MPDRPEPAVRVHVRRNGVSSHPWTAYCTDVTCERNGHLVPGIGGVGVNTRIGNRTQFIALAAAVHHLRTCHAKPAVRAAVDGGAV